MQRSPNNFEKFWKELRQRRVVNVITVYVAIGFGILQFVDIIVQPLHLPQWTTTAVIVLLSIGFVIAVILSWIFDITPGGIRRTKSVKYTRSGKEDLLPEVSFTWKIIYIISALTIISLLIFNILTNRRQNNLSKLEKSIAVLPFRNETPLVNEDNTAFINGLMDEIRINLRTIKTFRVISSTSVEQFSSPLSLTIPEIGKKLGVNYIVEGSAQIYGKKLRLRVQLIRAEKESNLWANSYDEEINNVNDVFDIQTRVAKAIALELTANITPEEEQLFEKTPTNNSEAFRLFTLGNYFMSQWGEDNFRKAIDKYKQAIDLDPEFAKAYANLASAYFELTMWDVVKPYPEFQPLAREMALKALELENNLGEPYFVLGCIEYIHELNFKDAEQHFKRGMSLNPDFVWGRINYANFLSAMGRFKESITISQETVELNPLDPGTYNELGYAKFHDGQDREALDLFSKSLELKPNSWNAIGCLTEFYSVKGIFNQFLSDQIDTLLGSPRKELKGVPSSNLTYAGLIYARTDQHTEALMILEELNKRSESGSDQPGYIDLGYIYNELGEKEKAIDLFEKGYKNKESWLWIQTSIRKDDPVRSNKRFDELLHKMGFEN